MNLVGQRALFRLKHEKQNYLNRIKNRNIMYRVF